MQHCMPGELYRTFSGISGRLGSSGLSAPASESTTERPEVSNHLTNSQGGGGGGANQKVIFTEQAKMTPRKEIRDNTVSGTSFLLC